MTQATAAALRAERRHQRRAEERRERMEVALGAILAILLLAAFAVAGTLDYQDRVRDLTGSYDPDWYVETMPGWLGGAQ